MAATATPGNDTAQDTTPKITRIEKPPYALSGPNSVHVPTPAHWHENNDPSQPLTDEATAQWVKAESVSSEGTTAHKGDTDKAPDVIYIRTYYIII